MTQRLRYLLPNSITFLSSLSALVALYLAYFSRDRVFAYFILLSGVFDGLDGPLAKWLDAKSRFGSLYDTLSDLLAFGIAPAISLVFLGLLSPVVAAIYILAIQFRLTRFASSSEKEEDERFFRGLSALDGIYVGIFLSYLPFSNFNWGFGVVSVLAVYPGKFTPKGLRFLKFLLGLGATLLFVYVGN